jgi:hypothetical protein
LEDIFFLLDRAAANYTLSSTCGVFTAEVRIGVRLGKTTGKTKARTITLALALAIGIEMAA